MSINAKYLVLFIYYALLLNDLLLKVFTNAQLRLLQLNF